MIIYANASDNYDKTLACINKFAGKDCWVLFDYYIKSYDAQGRDELLTRFKILSTSFNILNEPIVTVMPLREEHIELGAYSIADLNSVAYSDTMSVRAFASRWIPRQPWDVLTTDDLITIYDYTHEADEY